MSLNCLLGSKLISISEDEMVVENGVGQAVIKIIQDEGGCCGFNDVTATLLINGNDRPVITKVEEVYEDKDDESVCRITLFGSYKAIATLETRSSSGSGWQYGACVIIKCESPRIDEQLTCW